MLKRNKYSLFLILLLITTLILVGCSSSSTINNDEDTIVYKTYSTNDFSYKYPSSWNTTSDNEFLNNIRSLFPVDMYSSGVVSEGNNYQQKFSVIALDVSNYITDITETDLIDFAYGYDSSFRNNNPTAVLIESSQLLFNNNSAVKLVYEFFDSESNKDMKLEVLATYKGLNFYMIFYGSEKSGFSDSIGIFTEMKESLKFYE